MVHTTARRVSQSPGVDVASERVALRIERVLESVMAMSESSEGPPMLSAAMHHAVFPGGARVRPKLCLAVAVACGDPHPHLSDAAAAAIELLHCASLVHDDLPCFDGSALRRGVASVHVAFGERQAVLAGDALIVLAFQALASVGAKTPALLSPLTMTIARCVGAPMGIVAGQAWESEKRVALSAYHRAKTGSLFMACTEAAAWAAEADPLPWRQFGLTLGEAYQVADDVRDVVATTQLLGKPAGRDRQLNRPSSASELGLSGAIEHFDSLVEQAIDAIPACAGASMLRSLVLSEAERLVPQDSVRHLALAT
jgi:geranylgeranyl diphosphate synthase, type II